MNLVMVSMYFSSNFRNRVRPVSGYVNHRKVGTLAGRYTYFCVGKNNAIHKYSREILSMK